ncbi:MAG: type II toxin-antitoxin system death-on-curing family toxin [Bacteroidota bacterium]|jgi:death-on-curing protein
MSIHFIPEEIVITIHTDLLQRYGGEKGLRDRNLLESALVQPKMTIRGKYTHRTIFDKAAANGFHICMNHPFVDGNKRVAFVLMDIFLQKNGWEISANEEESYVMMMTLASGKLSKAQLSSWLAEHSTRFSHR